MDKDRILLYHAIGLLEVNIEDQKRILDNNTDALIRQYAEDKIEAYMLAQRIIIETLERTAKYETETVESIPIDWLRDYGRIFLGNELIDDVIQKWKVQQGDAE